MNRETFRRWGAQLNRVYRVSFVDDDTLHETRRYIVKPKTLLFSSILLVLSIILITASLIVFTPAIREQIPGYLNPEYEIKQNEMLSKIADLEQDIEERDSLLHMFSRMVDGMEVPGAFPVTPTAQPNDSETPSGDASAAAPAEAPVQAIRVRNDGPAAHSDNPSMTRLFLPVAGKVRNAFDRSLGHYGVDIAAKEKATVMAATRGTVIFAEYSDRDGHVIGIASSDEVVTFYKHNSKLLKQVGQYVQAGQAIAIVGNTGENTNGPHLHFEVWRHGVPVDPVPYFPEWQ